MCVGVPTPLLGAPNPQFKKNSKNVDFNNATSPNFTFFGDFRAALWIDLE